MIKKLEIDLKNFNLVFDKYIFDLDPDEVNCYEITYNSATITCPSDATLDIVSKLLSSLGYNIIDMVQTEDSKPILRELTVTI